VLAGTAFSIRGSLLESSLGLILGALATQASTWAWSKSSKFLLVLASTVFLVSGPVGILKLIYIRFMAVYVFENGVSSSPSGGVCFCE
jgi:hypothetical protein